MNSSLGIDDVAGREVTVACVTLPLQQLLKVKAFQNLFYRILLQVEFFRH